MSGSQQNKSHLSILIDQALLVPDIEVEDIAIRLWCGDVMGMFHTLWYCLKIVYVISLHLSLSTTKVLVMVTVWTL